MAPSGAKVEAGLFAALYKTLEFLKLSSLLTQTHCMCRSTWTILHHPVELGVKDTNANFYLLFLT
jgi:hypothetical protein